MNSLSRVLGCAVALSCVQVVATAHAASWTPYISEEGGQQALCPAQLGAQGFGCSGRFCDNVGLLCSSPPFDMWLSDSYWSPYFSEEDTGAGLATGTGFYFARELSFEHVCFPEDAGGVVTGLRCSGDFCDNLSIQCTRLRRLTESNEIGSASLVDCGWQPAFSEEQGRQQYAGESAIAGVRCSGSNCDNVSLYVCTVLDPKKSCADHCDGFEAAGSCWCDDDCMRFNDCCRDHFEMCVPQF